MREQTFALEPRRRRNGSRDYEQREAQFKINPWEPGATGANQDALRGIGVQTPGERDAEERFKKKKKSRSPPPLLPRLRGRVGGVSFLLLARDEIERKRKSSRDIDIVCFGFPFSDWCGFLI